MRVANYENGFVIKITETEYRKMGSPAQTTVSFNGFRVDDPDPSHPLLHLAPCDKGGIVVSRDNNAAEHRHRIFVPMRLLPKGLPLFGAEEVNPVEDRATHGFTVPRPHMDHSITKRVHRSAPKSKVQDRSTPDMNTVAQAVQTLNAAKRAFGNQFVISLNHNGHVSVMFELK